MSSMHSSAQVSPVPAPVPAEVMRLEQLLGKIFNDEIEKALTEETASDSTGSAKPVNNLPESATLNHLLDFSPFFEQSHIAEQSGKSELKSIIEADDYTQQDYDRLQHMVEIQRAEILSLRDSLRMANDEVRHQNLSLAAKEDQLKYLPELFQKALMVTDLTLANEALSRDLQWEKAAHSQTAEQLNQLHSWSTNLHNKLWIKVAKFLGFTL